MKKSSILYIMMLTNWSSSLLRPSKPLRKNYRRRTVKLDKTAGIPNKTTVMSDNTSVMSNNTSHLSLLTSHL